MKNVIYRQLVSTDHNEYRRIRLESLKLFPDNFGTTYDEEFNSKSLKLDNAIKNSCTHSFAFGAFESNSNIIGLCGFIQESRLKTQHRGEIVQMYVAPEFSGQRVGENLLQLTIDRAFRNSQIEQIILSVVYTNEKAVHLYKKLGFTEYGKLENYFKTGSTYSTQLFLKLSKDDWH